MNGAWLEKDEPSLRRAQTADAAANKNGLLAIFFGDAKTNHENRTWPRRAATAS